MTSQSHLLPPLEPNEDHQHFLFLSSPSHQASLSSSSSLLCPISSNSSHDQGHQQYQEVDDNYVSHGGSSSDHQILSSPSTLEISGSEYGLKLSTFEGELIKDDHNQISNKGSVSWMSSKMRLMKRMINSDQMVVEKPTRSKLWFQDQKQLSSSPSSTNNISDYLSSNNNTIRVCSDCNTTRTPLWRSGPKGPKSLCNACGIRQRKARRAMAAATAAASNGVDPTTPETSSIQTNKLHQSKKKSGKGHVAQYNKRQCKVIATPRMRKNLVFEDFIVTLSKNLAFHRVFPQDETEAAILLMALSCGLVSG